MEKKNFIYEYTDYSKYTDVNNLPIREDEGIELEISIIPVFMLGILGDTCVSNRGKLMFMRKFGIRYLSDSEFREITKDYYFLFYNMQYVGAYPSEDKAIDKKEELDKLYGIKGSVPFIPGVQTRVEQR